MKKCPAIVFLILSAGLLAANGPMEKRFENPANWLSYDGDNTGQRFSKLHQITSRNVSRLAAEWAFQLVKLPSRTEATPLVRDGILYITAGGEEAFALDARTGRPIWSFEYLPPGEGASTGRTGPPKTPGEGGRRANWNRGFGLSGDRLFMATSDCAIIALDARNGSLLWRSQIADPDRAYGATGAPLIVKNLVLIGVRGGDTGLVRGFVDAYDVESGKRAWRFYTVPAPGEQGGDSWPSDTEAWKVGGAATWTAGTYDPELDLIYWPTGNPGPNDFEGSDRKGDNLYSNSVVALRPENGELVWHYQFTPHDLNDWDSNETPVLIDRQWRGRTRKLLLQANRNGFFYVLDRTNGELLLAEPFVFQNWAKKIGQDGRPQRKPDMTPVPKGVFTCPDIHGGTNWQAPAYHPETGLFYVVTRDACGYFYPTGSTPDVEKRLPQQGLKAIEVNTGKIRWEYKFLGNQELVTHAGALVTAGDVLFLGGRDGQFIALDARNGKQLWNFNTGGTIRASPMTYEVAGRQYVAIFTKAALFTFALKEEQANAQ
jgi:alcohol dehydrogenase (cytochrome c)